MAQKLADKIDGRRQLIQMRASFLCGLDDDAIDDLAGKPPTKCLRFNPLVAPVNQTLESLKDAGVQLTNTDWLPDNCYLMGSQQVEAQTADATAAVQTAIASGAAYFQNPSSFIPVLALDPQPSEVILDLCASPGGKASYIAALTENMAQLWLNDTSFDRLQKLKRVCSLLNVIPEQFTLAKGEAASKKFQPEFFDSIIIDAPCSGEDIRLISSDTLGSWSPAKVKRLAELQKKLIKEAWKLLKPGGALVYSTCSQAPEEDEAVVSWFLGKHEDAATLPIKLPHHPSYKPALASWNGHAFDPGLANAIRVTPDTNHISFFACKIAKLPSGRDN